MFKRWFVLCHFLAVQWSAEHWLAVWRHSVAPLMQLSTSLNSCINVIFAHFSFLHCCVSPEEEYRRLTWCCEHSKLGGGAPFPSHFSLHDGSANYLSFQMPVRCQTHSLPVFCDNLHCITSTMAQVPVFVAKFLFNAVQPLFHMHFKVPKPHRQ